MANSAQGHKVLRHSGRRQTESARREIKVYLAGRNNPTPHACNPSSSSTASSNVRLPDYLPITFLQVCLEILSVGQLSQLVLAQNQLQPAALRLQLSQESAGCTLR